MKNNEYDAIIIGAGIGGLVCGCYLAKAGMKVLIVEKNAKPGGYCTSFRKNGFLFDACGHTIGSLGKNGSITKILKELGLYNRKEFLRYDPQDAILSENFIVYFWNDLRKTIADFQKNFPEEGKNIQKFFSFIYGCKGIAFTPLRNLTFNSLLDKYFRDSRLKTILSLLILGNTGTSPSEISAYTAVTVFKEFILDGGYYPAHGAIEEFPALFTGNLKKHGGRIIFSNQVKKILFEKDIAIGIMLGKKAIKGKYIISDVDCNQTFSKMIKKHNLPKGFLENIYSFTTTSSMYILHLGFKKGFSSNLTEGTTNWIFRRNRLGSSSKVSVNWCAVKILGRRKKNMIIFTSAPFMSQIYWIRNKRKWMDNLLQQIQKIIPNLSHFIECKIAITPFDLHKLTLNSNGARCGWKSIPSQIMVPGMTNATLIENLYLVGHWTTQAVGIPGVAYVGKETAKIILQREKLINKNFNIR